MPATLAVTDAEFTAIIAARALSQFIASDSQYQVTEADRAIRARGAVAYAAALQRHNDWDFIWMNAGTEAARGHIETLCATAESNMKRVPFVKGGNP